jgi:chromosomal replication initiation ATPase DnaA
MTTEQRQNQYMAITTPCHTQYLQLWSIREVAERTSGIILQASYEALRAGGRSRACADMRQVAMYLAHVSFGLTLTEVGILFGRDRTTVAHGCARVEDRREHRAFDLALDIADHALRRAFCRGGAGQGMTA